MAICWDLRGYYESKIIKSQTETWCGRRESNPRLKLGKLSFYHYTTPAGVWYSIQVWQKSPDKKRAIAARMLFTFTNWDLQQLLWVYQVWVSNIIAFGNNAE